MVSREPRFRTGHRRSRHVRTPHNLEPIRLTGRDVDILRAVGEYRILTTGQICKLFFRSIHKARKRLFKLWQHHLIDRRFAAVRFGEGSSNTLYVLSRQGARMLAMQPRLSQSVSTPAPPERNGSPLFLDHTLARNDLRIVLTLGCRREAEVELISWEQNKSIKENVTLITGEQYRQVVRVPLFPDATFVIRHHDRSKKFYLEIDRGTTSLKRLARKLLAYNTLLRRDDQIRGQGSEHIVLLAVTNETRANNLRQVIGQIPDDRATAAKRFIVLTTCDWKDSKRLLSNLVRHDPADYRGFAVS